MSSFLRSICLVLALALPAGGAAAATDELDRGPKVGMTIPHDLKARDQTGQYQDFKSLARARGLIVLFNRSLSW